MCEKKISVVVPFYNNVIWLKEAIDSVLSQSYTNYEIILINDGSTENLERFLEEYKNKLIYYYQPNSGPGRARNKGIELASGDYVAFLDSDDVWEEKKLEIQVKFMEKYNFSWSYTGYRTFGEKKSIIRLPGKMEGMIFPLILDSSRIGTPTIMIKTVVLKTNKDLRFNENMRFSQDYYLWVMISRKYPIGAINEVLCKVRMRGTNAEKSIFNHIKARKIIWEKISSTETKQQIKQIPRITRLGFFVNNTNYNFICKISSNLRIREFISKFLYIVPLIIFKSHLWLSLKKKDNFR